MKQIDNLMNIKPPRTDLNRSSPQPALSTEDAGHAQKAPNEGLSARSDSITLSETASAISKLQEYLSAVPDVDNARVTQIKAAIEDGSYRVDPEKIALNLLDVDKGFFS